MSPIMREDESERINPGIEYIINSIPMDLKSPN